MDIQADLSLCLSHKSYCRFCHALAHICFIEEIIHFKKKPKNILPWAMISNLISAYCYSWLSNLDNTKWLQNMSSLLKAATVVVSNNDKEGRPVLVHCSDGWDRTPQVISLSELMLDPYYRKVQVRSSEIVHCQGQGSIVQLVAVWQQIQLTNEKTYIMGTWNCLTWNPPTWGISKYPLAMFLGEIGKVRKILIWVPILARAIFYLREKSAFPTAGRECRVNILKFCTPLSNNGICQNCRSRSVCF